MWICGPVGYPVPSGSEQPWLGVRAGLKIKEPRAVTQSKKEVPVQSNQQRSACRLDLRWSCLDCSEEGTRARQSAKTKKYQINPENRSSFLPYRRVSNFPNRLNQMFTRCSFMKHIIILALVATRQRSHRYLEFEPSH